MTSNNPFVKAVAPAQKPNPFAAALKKDEPKVVPATQEVTAPVDIKAGTEEAKKEVSNDAAQGTPTVPVKSKAALFANLANGGGNKSSLIKAPTIPQKKSKSKDLEAALDGLSEGPSDDEFAALLGASVDSAEVETGEKRKPSGVQTIIARAKITAEDFTYPNQPDKYTDEEVKELQEAFLILENSLTDKEMVSKSVRHVLSLTKQNPYIASAILAPEDVAVMVEGLKKSYGVAITKKRERVDKKQMKEGDAKELMNELQNAGFSL